MEFKGDVGAAMRVMDWGGSKGGFRKGGLVRGELSLSDRNKLVLNTDSHTHTHTQGQRC